MKQTRQIARSRPKRIWPRLVQRRANRAGTDRLFRNEDLLLGNLSGHFGPTHHASPFKSRPATDAAIRHHRNNCLPPPLGSEITKATFSNIVNY